MDYRIDKIEGVGPAYTKKLAIAGIHKTSQLLSQCASAKCRKAVAGQMADFMSCSRRPASIPSKSCATAGPTR